jgi:PGF-CTERM protein
MKSYILVLVVLCSLSSAAPVMAAANLTADQISYTEMWVNGTGFTSGATVTLSTSAIIPVTPSGGAYSYEITGMNLPAGSVLTLDASPVNDDIKLYVKKNWLLKKTFENGSVGISYNYIGATDTVQVGCSSIPSLVAGTFQTIKVYGTTADPSVNLVNLSVTVRQDVTADGIGSFSEKVDISAIPAGDYMISAIDDDLPPNSDTTNTTIYAPGQLHHIAITDPQTSELKLNTTGNRTYTFNATGYDLKDKVVQNVAFTWWSSSTYIGTIDYAGDFEADHAGHTEVYAKSGAKESNHVIVYVNAPMNNTTLSSDDSFTLESDNANVSGIFDDPVNGSVTVQAIGNVTAATTVGLGAGYVFTSGAIVNVSGEAHTALEEGNGTVTIKLCVSDSELRAMGLARSNVQIYVYNDSAGRVGLTTTRVGTTDCYTADISVYLSEVTVGIGSKPAPSPSGGGGDGTYPPGWFGTPAPTAVPTSTPPPGVTPAPAGGGVTPAPAKPAGAGKTPAVPAGEEPTKKDIPGFTAVFAIAGMLAIAYMVMQRRR